MLRPPVIAASVAVALVAVGSGLLIWNTASARETDPLAQMTSATWQAFLPPQYTSATPSEKGGTKRIMLSWSSRRYDGPIDPQMVQRVLAGGKGAALVPRLLPEYQQIVSDRTSDTKTVAFDAAYIFNELAEEQKRQMRANGTAVRVASEADKTRPEVVAILARVHGFDGNKGVVWTDFHDGAQWYYDVLWKDAPDLPELHKELAYRMELHERAQAAIVRELFDQHGTAIFGAVDPLPAAFPVPDQQGGSK